MPFYHASMADLDLDTCVSLDSLRAVIFQVIYLLTRSFLSVAYKRARAGLAAALRMGLHMPNHALPYELQFRRRQVVAVLAMIHGYTASALGLPGLQDLHEEQMVPVRQDDLYNSGRAFVDKRPYEPESETILATKLFDVLSRVNLARGERNTRLSKDGKAFEVLRSDMDGFETDLERWQSLLPPIDTAPASGRPLLAQLMLRYYYAVALMGLYRPFLHHLTTDASDLDFNESGYAYGSACIRAAMQAVW